MIFWVVFLSIVTAIVALAWRIRAAINISAQWPLGIVGAAEVAAHLPLIRLRGAFALIKREDGWTAYVRIGNGKMRAYDQKALVALWKGRKKKPKKSPNVWLKAGTHGVRVAQLTLETHIGLEDAAQCALLCGTIAALLEDLLPAASDQVRINVHPVFNDKSFRLDLAGIAHVHTAKIIKDALFLTAKARRANKHEERETLVISTSH